VKYFHRHHFTKINRLSNLFCLLSSISSPSRAEIPATPRAARELIFQIALKLVGYNFGHDTTVKRPFRARLRVYVTRAIRPYWCNILGRAGFVNRAPRGIIADATAKKATELPHYTRAAGGDIRLPLVANRINNSAGGG
jgi:hypothetical protein